MFNYSSARAKAKKAGINLEIENKLKENTKRRKIISNRWKAKKEGERKIT